MQWRFGDVIRLIMLVLVPASVVFGQVEPGELPDSPTPQRPSRRPTPAEITEILDKILLDVRIAEEKGDGAQEAFQRALQGVTNILNLEPGNLRAEFYNARLMVLSQRERAALSRLQEWTESRDGSNDWEGHYILAQVYFNMQFFKLAEPILSTAIRLNPRESDLHLLMARCQANLIKIDSAIGHVNQAIDLMGDKVDPTAHLLMSEIQVQANRLADAAKSSQTGKELAQRKLQTEGANVGTLSLLERSLSLQIQIASARQQAEPDNPLIYMTMAQLLREQGQITSLKVSYTALSWSSQGLEKSGERPPEDLLVVHIRLLVEVGNVNEAMRVAERAHGVYPANATIKQFFVELKAATSNDGAVSSSTP